MEKKQLCHRFYRGYVKKLLMLMKLCLLFICVFTLTLSASSFAQQERVSFDLKNVSVKVLLDKFKNRRIGVSSLTPNKRNNWVSCRYG